MELDKFYKIDIIIGDGVEIENGYVEFKVDGN